MSASPKHPEYSESQLKAMAEAQAYGIDLSIGRELLRLTPTQWALQHQEALNSRWPWKKRGGGCVSGNDRMANSPGWGRPS